MIDDAARCGEGTQLPRIDIDEYMTDGSGTGSVQLTRGAGDARTVDVEREGEAWRVLRTR